MQQEPFRIGPFTFTSRLFVGTGKYADFDQMNACLEASGGQVVTVGGTDWVFALASDPAVRQVTANVLGRLAT